MKQINIQITVPDSDYCCNGPDLEICEHFNNEGGHPRCEIRQLYHFDSLVYDKKGQVLKLPACASGNNKLKEQLMSSMNKHKKKATSPNAGHNTSKLMFNSGLGKAMTVVEEVLE